jgi:hypothetical protein
MNERDAASGAPGSLAFEVIAALQAVETRLEAVLEP